MRTIVLSDCHIGSNESNYRLVNNFLNNLECDRLVLLGDFWDLWDMSPGDLRKRYADTMGLLRRILERGTRIEYVIGNHDEDYLLDPMMDIDAVPVFTNFTDISLPSGRRYALVHGHAYDPMYMSWYSLGRMLAWVNKTSRKILGISIKTFKRKTCTDIEDDEERSRAVQKIHQAARKDFAKCGYDGVIMGHTHCPTYEGGERLFCNAGDWKWSNTYVEILGEDVFLRQFCKPCREGRE